MNIDFNKMLEQLPMVVIIVFYTLKLLDTYTKAREKEQVEHEARIDQIMEDWRGFLKAKDAEFISALQMITAKHAESCTGITSELKTMSSKLDIMDSKLDTLNSTKGEKK